MRVKKNVSPLLYILLFVSLSLIYVLTVFLVQRKQLLRNADQRLYHHVQAMRFIMDQFITDSPPDPAVWTDRQKNRLKSYLSRYLKGEDLDLYYIIITKQDSWNILCREPADMNTMVAIKECRQLYDSHLLQKEDLSDLYTTVREDQKTFRSLILYFRVDNRSDAMYYIGARIPVLDPVKVRNMLLPTVLTALAFAILASIILLIYQKYFRSKELSIYREMFADQLTMLPNRNQLISDIRHTGNPVLIVINIQSFKHINSFYGTEMGDFILISLANQLTQLMKDLGHHLYRIQADEFALLLDKKYYKNDLKKLLEYLSMGVNEKTYSFQDHVININTYIGAAMGTDDQEEGDETLSVLQRILDQTAIALKRSKENHVPYVIYDRSMNIDEEIENNIKWTQRVKQAIKDERIIPYFQPIFNNHTRRVEKFECLARLKDEKGRIIAPYHFLSIAKQTQLYHQITMMIIKKSFEKFKENNYEFSINLSVKDILHRETREFIIGLLNNHPRQARNLVFEIVESEGIEHIETVTDFIFTVKKYGVKIAIDDFGSGYSNFANILKLKIDYIKIDASLIRNIDFDGNSQIITRSIIWFARELGLETISEFVHSEEVFEKACELGVDYSQGYYIGEPSEELEID